MNMGYFEDYSLLSERTADVVVSEIRDKPGLLLCAATGHSPEGLYRNLARRNLRYHLLDPLGIDHSSTA